MSAEDKAKANALAAIRQYIDSTPRQKILRDIETSRFAAYAGIGDILTRDSLLPIPNSFIGFPTEKETSTNSDFCEASFQLA